ncbi:SDR family NAD(P)-dependent oxidoreductase [candidate division KSB1 bacterium]
MRLKDKTALVTGSSRGIGRAIVLALAREGARAVVCYREQAAAADEVVAAIEGQGGRATAVALTVTSRESIRAALEEVKKKYGPIDILVNNAGINRPEDFDKITDEDWDDVLDINLTGAFRVTQEALPHLVDGGSVINISSVSGQYGGPRTSHYAVSKAGLIALTQNLAIFCAKRGIRVNAVSPGLIASEMAQAAKGLPIMERILLGRMGTPEEVGDAVVFLASEESSYMTAQVLNVNGGLYF